MTPAEMYAEFQSYLDADDGFFSGDEIWRKMHSAQQEIVRMIAQEQPSYYVQTATISYVADQALYDLPLNARLGSRILFTEDVENITEVPASTYLKEHLDYNSPGAVNLTDNYHFMLQGSQVRVMPTPGAAKTDALRIYYIPNHGQMVEGRISATGSSTLNAFTSDPDYSVNYGRPDVRNDYYNGMEILLTKNAGAGDTRSISDYTGGSTFQFTVSTAWSTSLSTTTGSVTEFAVMCPVPEDFHQMVPLRAAIDGAIKNRNRLRELQSVYYGSAGRAGLERRLLAWLQKRQETELQLVIPVDLEL